MTSAKAIEYQITQQLLRRREEAVGKATSLRLLERLISGLAVTVLLAAIGSYQPEMLWVLLGTSVIFMLGTK